MEVAHAFLNGVLIGLGLSILIGPILIILVTSSIERGRSAGFNVAAGIWFSDLLFIILVGIGLQAISSFIEQDGIAKIIGLIGGAILVFYGIYEFKRKPHFDKEKIKPYEYATLFVKGFMVNTVNPFTFIFWIGLMGALLLKNPLHHPLTIASLAGTFFTIILFDSLKVLIADRLKNFLKEKQLNKISRFAGLLFFAFGVFLIVRSLTVL